jgi:FkbH-like protein
MDFLAIKRNLRKDYSSFKSFRLGLLSDASSQFLVQALRGLAYDYSIDLQIYNPVVGNIHQELKKDSDLLNFNPEGVLVYNSLPVLKSRFYKTNLVSRTDFATDFLAELQSTLAFLSAQHIQHVFTNLFEVEIDAVFGLSGFQNQNSFAFQLSAINSGLVSLAEQNKSLALFQLPANHFDPTFYYSSQADISFEALPKVAQSVLQLLNVRLGVMKKCVVIDLDNTVWGGIVGDDGWENLEIGLLGRGKVFSDIQTWLKELKNRGILLAVCSKNEEANAKEVFLKHPDMVLRMEDIALFVANWKPKNETILEIANSLNIGLDSLVFLDDNPAERELVASTLPAVAVPDLPNDPSLWLSFLQKENLFETIGATIEDANRTEMYQTLQKRKTEQLIHASLDDYLASLQMKVKILAFDSFTLPRVAQMLQRTNQFNLRTIRHTESDLRQMIDSDHYRGFAFSLSDKFGDEGIVSALLLKIESDRLFIDSWVMSCRVFGRELEFLVFNKMLEESKKLKLDIFAEYFPTAKNQMVKTLLSTLGFEETAKGFVLKPALQISKSHHIAII